MKWVKTHRLLTGALLALVLVSITLVSYFALRKADQPIVGEISDTASIRVLGVGEHDGNVGIVYRKVNELPRLLNNTEILSVLVFSQQRDTHNHSLIPLIEDLAFKYASQAQFIWLDAKQELGWVSTYGVEVTPTVVVARHNTITGVITGDDALSREKVEALIGHSFK